MPGAHRNGFSLLEVLVALVLFAAVLLAMLSTGQFILAQLYDSDHRFRASLTAQSVLDSLRATACARLRSSASVTPPYAASWLVTDLIDVTRIDLTVTAPQRGSVVPRTYTVGTLLSCPES